MTWSAIDIYTHATGLRYRYTHTQNTRINTRLEDTHTCVFGSLISRATRSSIAQRFNFREYANEQSPEKESERGGDRFTTFIYM